MTTRPPLTAALSPAALASRPLSPSAAGSPAYDPTLAAIDSLASLANHAAYDRDRYREALRLTKQGAQLLLDSKLTDAQHAIVFEMLTTATMALGGSR